MNKVVGFALLVMFLSIVDGSKGTLHAAPFPTKPIHLVVGFSPGGGFDVTARAIASVAKEDGVVIVVDNIRGAGGRRAIAHTARSRADGYTTVIANMPMQLFYNLLKKEDFDLTEFTWIGQAVTQDGVVAVKKDSAIKSVNDLKGLEKFRLCIGGIAGHDGLLTVVMQDVLGFKPPQLVTGYTSSKAVPGLIKDECDVAIGVTNAIWTQGVKAGDVRLLAIVAPNRNSSFPNVPTFAELGYPQLSSPTLVNHGLIAAPKDTPREAAQVLEQIVLKASKDPKAIKVIETGGVTVAPLTGAETTKLVHDMKGLVDRYGSSIAPHVR